MAINVGDIKSFSDLKVLDAPDLIQYAKEVGNVDLDPALSRELLLSRCSSIYLMHSSKKKSETAGAVQPEEQKEKPAGAAEEKPNDPEKKDAVAAKKSTKKELAEQKKREQEHSEATGGKQDFPRCPYCATAITTPSGKVDGEGKPICTECAGKIKTKKGDTTMATAKATKKAGAKAAKKSTSTKTGKKNIAKEPAATDKYGFREGSKLSAIFAALIKGVTREELNKIGGKAVAGALAGIVKKPADWPAGRSVKWDEAKKEKGIYKIESWKPKA